MGMTQDEAGKISKQLRKARDYGPRSKQHQWEDRLCAKCNWEHMTRGAVLMDYGHPKEW